MYLNSRGGEFVRYYKAGEFAQLIGVTSVTLRKWGDKGLLIPHHRSPTGYRYYSEEQLQDYLSGGLYNQDKGGDANVRSQ